MTRVRLTVAVLDAWCLLNGVKAGSLGRYLNGGADVRERLSSGAMTLRTHDRIAKFLECHPIVPSRRLRDVAVAYLAAEDGADAQREADKVETTAFEINQDIQSSGAAGREGESHV